MTDIHSLNPEQLQRCLQQLQQHAEHLGFQQLGVSRIDLGEHPTHLKNWLANNFHGEMHYMQQREALRNNPADLLTDTVRVISLRMDYRHNDEELSALLQNPNKAYISRYALGRDYHKIIRKRLTQLAKILEEKISGYRYRAFVDSAPVLERAFAEQAGLGWIGKNTMLINPKAGSWFFLGEIYTNLPLPVSPAFKEFHCGSCRACIDACPTKAIVAPNQIDARRCISYLTIELKDIVPEEFRRAMGNRIYGCDDCQIVCPWNKFSDCSVEPDFQPRHKLDDISLLDLFSWDESTFLDNTAGSPIRRIGYDKWRSNIAIALGNAPRNSVIQATLQSAQISAGKLTKEAIAWALMQH